MTKTISGAMQSHLDGEETTICTCWRMELTFEQPKVLNVEQLPQGTVQTVYPHGFSSGDQVTFINVSGMTELNGLFEPSIVVTSAKGFTLANTNTTGFGGFVLTASAEVRQVLGFTNHDVDVFISGCRYDAETGTTPTALAGTSNLAVDNADLEGIIQSASLDEIELLWGAYDYAKVTILLANYVDPTENVLMKTGRIGQVRIERDQFVAEFRSLVAALHQDTMTVYSPGCRATLGDAECQVSLNSFRVSSTVGSVTSGKRSWDDSGLNGFASAYFDGGRLTWLTGANAGRTREVKNHQATSPATVELLDALPFTIITGDTYEIFPGCDKSIDTCNDTFQNTVNFRGFPHLPGLAAMLDGGDRTTVTVDDTP